MTEDLNTIERESIREHIEESTFPDNYRFADERPLLLPTVKWDGEEFELAGNFFNRLKIRARVAAYNVKQNIRNEILERLLTKIILKLDKNGEKWLRRAAKGDTFISKIIFGFLDVSAIPNFHEILKAVNKQYPNATAAEKAKLVVQKVDWTRTLVGIVFAIALAMGWVDLETIKAFM